MADHEAVQACKLASLEEVDQGHVSFRIGHELLLLLLGLRELLKFDCFNLLFLLSGQQGCLSSFRRRLAAILVLDIDLRLIGVDCEACEDKETCPDDQQGV